MSFKLTLKVHVFVIAISIAIIAMFYNNIINIIINFVLQPFMNYPFRNLILNFYIYYILIGVLVSIIHELIHGSAYKIFGGKVKYGFKFIYAYTMEISGKAISRNEFLMVLLAPVTIITLISLFLPAGIGNMVFLINFLGSIGDIYMGLFLCKINRNSRIIDRAYGFDII